MSNIACRARKKSAAKNIHTVRRLIAASMLFASAPTAARVFIDTEHHFKVVAPDNLALCTNHLFGATGPDHGPQIFLDVGAKTKCPDISSRRSVGIYAYFTTNQPQTLEQLVADTCANERCVSVSDPGLALPGVKSKAVRIDRPDGASEWHALAITKGEDALDIDAVLQTRREFLARDLDSFRHILSTVRILPPGEFCHSSEPLPWQEGEAVAVFEDCTVDMLSADGKIVLHVDRRGGLTMRPAGGGPAPVVTPSKINLRASFLWSPATQMFAEIHWSAKGNLEMRVYRRQRARFVADARFEKTVERLYGEKNRCGREGGKPDVWMLGWSPDGRALAVAAGPRDKSSCAGHPVAARLAVNSAQVQHVYKDAEIDKKYPRAFWSASVVNKSASGH